MKIYRYALGLLAALTTVTALFIGSIEICCFSDLSFYEQQYEKNNVLEAVKMDMPDLMDVTEYMLDYLSGKEETLSVTTVIDGQERDFFNDKERAHMSDVKALNLGARTLMYACIALGVVSVSALVLSFAVKKERAGNGFFCVLSRCLLIQSALLTVIIGISALIVSTDFDHYWRMFHTVFFTNDLWLLDPSTDLLINIVPLEFFIALVSRCAVLFLAVLLTLLVLCAVYLIKTRGKRKKAVSVRPSKNLMMCLAVCAAVAGNVNVSRAGESEDNSGKICALEDAPEITASNAILMDPDSGTILYSKCAEEKAWPASTTKLMTALLTLKNCELDGTVTFSSAAIYALTSGASHIGMTPGEELNVEQCLYALLLPSANEVANALAEHVSGSMSSFVELMNSTADSLGCVNTHFENPNGLHDSNHYTCAYDLALIFKECLETPGFTEIDSAVTYVIPATNLVDETRPMKTTNKFLQTGSGYYDSRVICGKTGHTSEAGGCLVTYARENDLGLICVVLGDEQPNEYTSTKSLLDYGFSNFYQASSVSLTELTDNDSKICSKFASSDSISAYEISSASGLVTDMENMTYDITGDSTNVVITFKSGSLALGSITLSPSIQKENPLSTRGLPYTYALAMEQPKTNVLIIIIPCALLAIAVAAAVFGFAHTKQQVLIRRQKHMHFYKNVNLKKIRLK